MNKIGVFGGTFDPVHYGHIYMARQAISECKLDKLLVIPAYRQPFKPNAEPVAGDHRINMAKLAFAADEAISVSDMEIKKGGISYTIDTLKEVKRLFDGDIAFIIGTDAFLKVEKWKDADELLKKFSFIIGTRPGYREDELEALITYLRRNYHTDIRKIKNRQISVSSTQIKQMLTAGERLGDLIPSDVERYIDTNGLY